MSAFNNLPYDYAYKVEKETERRMREFIKFNPGVYERMSFEEYSNFEDWLTTMTRYEFYRLYGIKKEDMPENDEIPEFRDLK